MAEGSRYERNVERWSFWEDAKLLPLVEFFHVSRSLNPDGTPNLKAVYNQPFYIHSTSDVQQEAKDWFSSLNLRNIEVLYVYGLGLGYYFDAAKDWLKESSKRFLVFLEDDLEVLRIFFETELAEKILNHPQVRVFYLDWNNKEYVLDKIISNFLFQNFKVTALNSYVLNKERFQEIVSLIAYFTSLKSGLMAEYISSGVNFFSNFYRNLLYLPSSYSADRLFGQFKNIPAIICGAGPSLEINGSILSKLKDRALIFAGGTAMNAINAQGIIPHFGVGVDPNIFQYSRLISNQAFETPYFYRNRMYHEAFRMIHGNRLYITGSSGYFISDWIEQNLGILSSGILSEGYNVINFSLSIAWALGCNPIVFVGVDLGYSQNRSYAPGIFYHAIHDPKQDFQTKSTHDELLLKDDINGKPIYTLWKWVHEALWFSQIAKENPKVNLYNCTQGGIGFPGVPNLTLEEAGEKYFNRQYDLDGLIHCAIQSSGLPATVTIQKVIDLLEELLKSFQECYQIYKEIELDYQEMHKEVVNGQDPPPNYVSEKISNSLSQIADNPAYTNILKIFEWKHKEYTAPRFRNIDYEAPLLTPREVHLKKIGLFIMLYRFLEMTAKVNITSIEATLAGYREAPTADFSSEEENAPHFPHAGEIHEPIDQIYRYEQGSLTIKDPELGIDFKAQLPQTIQYEKSFYPSGAKKMEAFYDGDELSGPSTFYHDNGTIISQSWFVEGKKQGKAWFYYPDGSLCSRQQFKDGEKEGLQEYFYQDGTPKTIMHYSKGVLNGDVFLFHPNGKLMREIHYLNGHRHGEEKMWSGQGILLIEAEYDMDKPIRTAREWYENGNLAKEIIYDQDSKRSIFRRWDEGGMPWKPELLVHEDFFDKVTNQSMLLTEAINEIVSQLKILTESVPYTAGKTVDLMKGHIQSIEARIEKLRRIGEELKFESGSDPRNPSEAIWKSESMRREIQQQLEFMTNKMANEIKGMLDMLSLTKRLVEENQQKKEKGEPDPKAPLKH